MKQTSIINIFLSLLVDNIFALPWVTLKCEKIEDYEWPEVGNVSTCFNTNLVVHSNFNVITHLEGSSDGNTILGLHLQGNRMGDIPQEIQSVLPNLEALSLTHSSIYSLDLGREVLLNVGSNLKVLNLSHNLIDEISAGVFDYPHLSTLKVVDLSSNSISSLPDGVFAKLNNLKILNLANNSIVRFKANYLSTGSGIKELYINNNQIEQIPYRMMYFNINQIEILDLSSNQCVDGKYDGSKDTPLDLMNLVVKMIKYCKAPGE